MTSRRNIKTAFIILQLMLVHKAFGNGLSTSIVSQNVADTSEVSNNEERNNTNSREDLAYDAQDQGAKGSGIAYATGAVLLSIGIPMSLSLEPITMAAGIDLIAKAGMEFAQGAQNAEGANYNADQRATLNGTQAAFITPVPAEITNNPDLDKLLADSGVNADDFKSKLASGEFQSGADIMRALGKNFDPEVVAQAESLANDKMGAIFAGAKSQTSELGANTITASDDTSKANSAGNNSQTDSGNSLAQKNYGSNSQAGRELASSQPSDKQVKAITPNSKASQAEGLAANQAGAGKGGADGFQAMLNKMLGHGDASVVEKNMLLQGLVSRGIQLSVKGVSIFDLAHRNYKSFGKTRKFKRNIALR